VYRRRKQKHIGRGIGTIILACLAVSITLYSSYGFIGVYPDEGFGGSAYSASAAEIFSEYQLRVESGLPGEPGGNTETRKGDEEGEATEKEAWYSYYVQAETRVPIHLLPMDASHIIGYADPRSVIYGYAFDDAWTCVADNSNGMYYVKNEYLTTFGAEQSAISVFAEHDETHGQGFTTNARVDSISGLTLEGIQYLLDYYPGMEGIGEQVLLCERIYDVNAYFIIAVASLESGFGKSLQAQNKNNLFGLGAYDHSAYESALSFESKAEGVEYFCELISDYYKSGRRTPASINQRYASDELWAHKVVRLMNSYSSIIEKRV